MKDTLIYRYDDDRYAFALSVSLIETSYRATLFICYIFTLLLTLRYEGMKVHI